MKKLLVLAFAAVLVLSLSSCSVIKRFLSSRGSSGTGSINVNTAGPDDYHPADSPSDGMSKDAYKLGSDAMKIVQDYKDGLLTSTEAYEMLNDIYRRMDSLYETQEKGLDRYATQSILLDTNILMVLVDLQSEANGESNGRLDGDIEALKQQMNAAGGN